MPSFNTPDEVYAFLNLFLNFERKIDPVEYRLDRMHSLKKIYGEPDTAFQTIHVAGSKGKGSTSTMLARIVQQKKNGVGLYTSPHLLYFTERIAIDGEPVSDEILLASAAELAAGLESRLAEDYPGGEEPTYFELLTMLAFLCFRRAGCWIAVIEVGLGGRLDSTNIINPIASVITPIELEHTEILGDTIEKIAMEKAGIIKTAIPVFVNSARGDAIAVFREKARCENAPLLLLSEEMELSDISISADGTRFSMAGLKGGDSAYKKIFTIPMIGKVQAQNAALAALSARALGFSWQQIEGGLAKARLRARFEILPLIPAIVLDGAHTPDSIHACAEDFATVFPGGGILLFGCAKDKNAEAMAFELQTQFREVIITKPGTFKESDTRSMSTAFLAHGFSTEKIEDTKLAIETARSRSLEKKLPLLVCGSFYLCAEAAALFGSQKT